MSYQPLATPQVPGADKLITPAKFLDLLITWTDENLSKIASLWSMPGEGWEDPFRTGLTEYIHGQYLWADLGAPDTRKVYKTDAKQADFVLNGTVATRSADKVIVEVKCQSLGRLKDFRVDFEKDIKKLAEVADAYADCPRRWTGRPRSSWKSRRPRRREPLRHPTTPTVTITSSPRPSGPASRRPRSPRGQARWVR